MGKAVAVVCGLVMVAAWAAPAPAQTTEVKEKPPMYSYVGNWAIPRAQWAEMEKNTAGDAKLLDKALASGTLIGYGNDVNLVHQDGGMTHDDWWSSMSMAGLVNVLEQFYAVGGSVTPVLSSATKHADVMYVSHYYNWHPGTYKGVYTHVSTYKLKADAPDDAVELLSKSVLVPFFEKLLSSGVIHEYEVDELALHSETPGTFSVVYIVANADGLDKVDAALRDNVKSNQLIGPAFGGMIDFTVHRDYLARTNATYK